MSNSFPAAFEARMKATLGDEWTRFAQAFDTAAPVSVRINPRKPVKPLSDQPVPWSRYGYYLPQRPSFTLDPSFHAGAYYVQEASSMMLEQVFAQVLAHHQAVRVLDLCAAPGGKSTHVLSLLNDSSLLVSNEVIRSRAGILAENIQKWGYANAVVCNNDPEDFQRLPGFFDVMIVDAPCSGEGLFRKDPQAMNEWSPDNVALCSKRQRRILADVWSALKEDGILVYSTCTYNAEENEENLQWLGENHGVEFLKLTIDPAWGVEETHRGGAVGYRLYPHRVNGEGFFLSMVRKKEQQSGAGGRGGKQGAFAQPTRKVQEQVDGWLAGGEKIFIQRQDLVQYFPALHAGAIELLSKNLRLVTAGTFVATVKHDKLIPEHALALSADLRREAFPTVELAKDDALKYLRKETLNVPSAQKGFALVTHEDLALGWVNMLPNRMNNLYPAEWRIRM